MATIIANLKGTPNTIAFDDLEGVSITNLTTNEMRLQCDDASQDVVEAILERDPAIVEYRVEGGVQGVRIG